MRSIKTLAVCVVAVFALSAVAASAASAKEFKVAVGGTYPVTVKAKGTNFHGFKVNGAVSVCEESSFEGKAEKASNELTIHPEYKKCVVAIAGANVKAKVTTTGCNYKFLDEQKQVNIVCEGANVIKVVLEGAGETACEITVAPQEGLKTVTYTNVEEASFKDVLVEANVTGIHYKSTCKAVGAEGANGEYKEGKFNELTKVAELGEGSAKALAKGFNGEGKQEGIEA